MSELDPTRVLRAVEARLRAEDDERKRQMLSLLVRHMAAETSAADVGVLAETIADDIEYRFLGSSPALVLRGRDEVETFTQRFFDEVGTDVEFVVGDLMVGQDCVALQGLVRRAVDGAGADAMRDHFGIDRGDAATDVRRATVVQTHMAVFYRFDVPGLVVGKDMYASLR